MGQFQNVSISINIRKCPVYSTSALHLPWSLSLNSDAPYGNDQCTTSPSVNNFFESISLLSVENLWYILTHRLQGRLDVSKSHHIRHLNLHNPFTYLKWSWWDMSHTFKPSQAPFQHTTLGNWQCLQANYYHYFFLSFSLFFLSGKMGRST